VKPYVIYFALTMSESWSSIRHGAAPEQLIDWPYGTAPERPWRLPDLRLKHGIQYDCVPNPA
jgi:hypothetical protein